MAALIPLAGDDPRAVLVAVRRALDGGPAVGLGMSAASTGTGGSEAPVSLDGSEPVYVRQPIEVPDGTAAVIATSGSTGVPKRVMLSAAALRASAAATAARLGGAGRWVLALPAGYVAGLQVLVRSHLAGAEPVLLDGRFGPEAFADAVRAACRPGGDMPLFASLVPAQVATLLDAGAAAALAACDAVLVGGQAMPAALRERAEAEGVRIVRTYGSSETSGGCVYDGVPLDGVRLTIVDSEVRIAGPVLADGYLGDDALTARTFVHDAGDVRWYRTGDAGAVEDGVLRIQGRIDNVIVSGGVNVSLDRVERVVRGVPGLTDAVVVGVADDRWGEASIIVTTAGEELLADARAAVAAEIGLPARPARLVTLAELPLLASGKPDRSALARLLPPSLAANRRD